MCTVFPVSPSCIGWSSHSTGGVEMGACGMRLVGLLVQRTGRNRLVGVSSGTQPQGNRHVEEAMGAYRQEERPRLAHEMPPQERTLPLDDTLTGGLCLVGRDPESHSMVLEHTAAARDHDTWDALMEQALAGLNCQVIQSTSDEAPGLLAYVEHALGVHHSPDLFHGQHELSTAVSAPMATTQRAAAQAEATRKRVHESLLNANEEPHQRGPGRRPKGAARLAQGEQEVAAARQAHQRLPAPREQVTQGIRAIGHASHCVDLERGVRRNGTRIAGDLQQPITPIRTMAQEEGLSERCMERIEKAERVVPTRQATLEFVSRYGRQQVRQLDLAPPTSYALHAHLLPSFSLDRVASTRTGTQGEPLRELAARLRTPLFAPGGTWGALHPLAQNPRKAQAARLAEVCQRSSSKVEGRNGDLALRNHQLRGLDLPRKRACLTAVHNFLLTRPDGTTAAERFCGQKPRSMFAAILESVEIPPAPLSPPRRAVG
jgi:Family of unknown function (DUF6399)